MLGTFGLRAYRHVHVYTCERRISVCASHEHHIRLNWVKALHVARGTSGTSHQTLRACLLLDRLQVDPTPPTKQIKKKGHAWSRKG